MSETEKPKRKFWQLHLSTAIIAMLVFSAFSCLNFIPLNVYKYNLGQRVDNYVYGWPVEIVIRQYSNAVGDFFFFRVNFNYQRTGIYWLPYPASFPKALVFIGLNICVALFSTLTAVFICEWLIRRREGRKP